MSKTDPQILLRVIGNYIKLCGGKIYVLELVTRLPHLGGIEQLPQIPALKRTIPIYTQQLLALTPMLSL